jgi:hypothetical protein
MRIRNLLIACALGIAASPELKAAMEKSGVKGAPQIWYTAKSAR